jgi:hypothetical protein
MRHQTFDRGSRLALWGGAIAALLVGTALALLPRAAVHAQTVADRTPRATLIPAATVMLRSTADSNSPAVWQLVGGRQTLFALTSVSGWPTRHAGAQVNSLAPIGRIVFATAAPVHGVWMESIIPDVDGTWYGYYHNELPATLCSENDTRTLPRIGAARSRDFGQTWEDLGIILEAPRGWHDCDTNNRYFVGGVGDFSAVLDAEGDDLYFFFSQYANRESRQGVAVARLAWADRDQPSGRIAVWWRGSTWAPARRVRMASDGAGFTYPAGIPIYAAQQDWHDDDVDAFWGPSVHWNTFLQQYVMLLNRAHDVDWRQEGIYVAFSKSLSDPTAWSTPQRLLGGGEWYPQVIGIEPGTGTDRIAGERARFFMGGRSQYFIQFSN